MSSWMASRYMPPRNAGDVACPPASGAGEVDTSAPRRRSAGTAFSQMVSHAWARLPRWLGERLRRSCAARARASWPSRRGATTTWPKRRLDRSEQLAADKGEQQNALAREKVETEAIVRDVANEAQENSAKEAAGTRLEVQAAQ